MLLRSAPRALWHLVPASRRALGAYAFAGTRVPLLEELFEPPVLKRDEMSQDAVSILKGYTPPALAAQVEAALSAEFNRHIVKTDWQAYTDPIKASQYEQAARLLELTLATIRRSAPKYQPPASPPPTLGDRNERWLRNQCSLLLHDIQTGDTRRWVRPEHWIGRARWDALSERQRTLLAPTVALLGRNPHFHPNVKRRLLEEIIELVDKTVTREEQH